MTKPPGGKMMKLSKAEEEQEQKNLRMFKDRRGSRSKIIPDGIFVT